MNQKKIKKNSNIIFVSGPSRSGTTLLQVVLSSHPMIDITPETMFIKTLIKLGRHLKHRHILSKKEIVMVTNSIKNDEFLSTWPYPVQKKILNYIDDNANISINDILEFLFNYYSSKTNKKPIYIGNKQEIYVDGLGSATKKLFPRSKFIIIVRDPRDVTSSIIKNFSSKRKRSIIKSAATTYSANRYIKDLKLKYPEDVLVLRYEDLVEYPEKTCDNICKYLGIKFNSKMISFYKQNKSGNMLIGNTKNIHKHTITPFNTDLINQWKKGLSISKEDLRTIELINADYMEEYNYQKNFYKSIFFDRLLILLVYLRFMYKHIKYKFF